MKKALLVLCALLIICVSAFADDYKVGDEGPAGGIIFYDKGEYSDGWRYLEAAPADVWLVDGVPALDLTFDEYYADEEYRKIPGYLGVCAQEKSKGDEFKYGIGCKATDVDGIPNGFEIIHIPQYDWAVFKCVGPSPKAIQDMWERIYKEWLPVSDYELIPDVDIENYLPGDPSSRDYVSEICIPVQKRQSIV